MIEALQLGNDIDTIVIPLERRNERLRSLLPSDERDNRKAYADLRVGALEYLVSKNIVEGYRLSKQDGIKYLVIDLATAFPEHPLNVITQFLEARKARETGQLSTFDSEAGLFTWHSEVLEFKFDSLRYWILRLTLNHKGRFVSFTDIEECIGKEVSSDRVFTDAITQINDRFRKKYKIKQVMFVSGSKVKMVLPE